MTKVPLGRLKQVELREYWASESQDFTPWLAREDNVALLAETLGIELEVQGIEKDVGTFRADILCKDIGTDLGVLIENQLEKTDHSHLGQIVTYAAGLDVHTVVWIARTFNEEHREALVWLNEVSKGDIRFFGLEVELWCIGDSAPAPKFNIVVKPNDWTKQVRDRAGDDVVGASGQAKLAFWTAFHNLATTRKTPLRLPQPMAKHWMIFRLGRSGILLSAVASTYNAERRSYEIGEIRAQVVIQSRDAQAVFRRLIKQRDEIDAEFGEALKWTESADVKRRTISISMAADIEDQQAWPRQHEWLLERLERLQQVFGPKIKAGDDEEA